MTTHLYVVRILIVKIKCSIFFKSVNKQQAYYLCFKLIYDLQNIISKQKKCFKTYTRQPTLSIVFNNLRKHKNKWLCYCKVFLISSFKIN